MKKTSILSILMIIFVFGMMSFAQTNESKSPYRDGESLTFEGKYKRFGFSFSIAEMNFTVSKLPDSENYFINSQARSKGTLTKLFNFKFFQRYESTVDGKNLRILKTEKKDVQGNRVRESTADFDYQAKRVTYVETDPNDKTRPPRRVASNIDLDTQDIVTAVYMLRTKELAVGKTFTFKVSDSGLIYDVPIKITARERKKSILGKKWCWRVEPEIFGDGRFIEQKGSFKFWITDDEQKIPVRAEIETELGDVKIKLKKVQTKTNSKNTKAKNGDKGN